MLLLFYRYVLFTDWEVSCNEGNMTIGSVITLGLYFQLFVQPVTNFSIIISNLMRLCLSLTESMSIDMDSEVLDSKESKKVESSIIAKIFL